MTLREIESGRALSFEGQSPFGPLRGTWSLIVVPDGPNRTRLLARDRASSGGPAVASLLSREMFEPMHFVMEQRMFLGITLVITLALALLHERWNRRWPLPGKGQRT